MYVLTGSEMGINAEAKRGVRCDILRGCSDRSHGAATFATGVSKGQSLRLDRTVLLLACAPRRVTCMSLYTSQQSSALYLNQPTYNPTSAALVRSESLECRCVNLKCLSDHSHRILSLK